MSSHSISSLIFKKSFKELQSEEEAFSDVLSSALSSFQQVCMLSSQRVGGESSRNIFILNCHLECKACLSSQSECDDLILSLVTAITDSVVQDQVSTCLIIVLVSH